METRLYTVLGIEANIQFNDDDDEYTCIINQIKSVETMNGLN